MMSAIESIKSRPLLSPSYVNGIYIPSALLIIGTYIVKSEWIGYAVALSLLLSGWKVFNNEPKAVLHPKNIQSFPLESKTILSHNTAIYRFSLPTPTSILGLPTGQHIAVHASIPWSDTPDKQIFRSYTPVSSDHTPGHFDLLIKAYPTGNVSKLIAQLPVGGSIAVSGPRGNMRYSAGLVRRFGMIAGGSGITPMLQIVREIHRGRPAGDRTEVDLIFANVAEQDILLREDLDALAAEDAGFRVHYVLNEPPKDRQWTGGVGFVNKEMIERWMPKPAPDIKILVCGPPPMVKAMRGLLDDIGYDKSRAASKLEDQVFCF